MLGIFTKLLVIMLCAVLCDSGDTCTNDSCKAFKLDKKNFNKRLIGHGILEKAVNVIHDCARHCFYYKICKSFDFNRKERPSCKLNNVTGDSAEATFEAKAGAVFSDITEWPSNMAGECGQRLCSVTQRCLPAKDSFKCIDIKCKKLPTIKNGKTVLNNPGQMSYQDTAIVKCDAGHYAEKSIIECQVSEEWETASCVYIECKNLPTIKNGKATLSNPGQMSYQDTAVVECGAGHYAEKSIIECQVSGEWEAASCVYTECGKIGSIPNAVTTLDNPGHMAYMDTASLSCDEGYETNKTSIQCQANGVWESSTCEKKVCGVPSVTNGVVILVNEGQMSYLDMAEISCSEGYETLKSTIQCQASGEWELSTCREIGLKDCKQIHSEKPDSPSGIYDIKLWKSGTYITVFCEMETQGGGWTVFQNRFDGSVDFYRNFSDYENGFGDVNGEFWLGLRYIQEMAELDPTSNVLLEMTRENGTMGYEIHSHFELKQTDYKLYIGSSSPVSLSDNVHPINNLILSIGNPFSTYDRDRDQFGGKCAEIYHGGWWYGACTNMNLNGKYCPPGAVCEDWNGGIAGLTHEGFAGLESLKASRMMITRASVEKNDTMA